MKRTFGILLISLFVITLTGCDNKNDNNLKDNQTQINNSTEKNNNIGTDNEIKNNNSENANEEVKKVENKEEEVRKNGETIQEVTSEVQEESLVVEQPTKENTTESESDTTTKVEEKTKKDSYAKVTCRISDMGYNQEYTFYYKNNSMYKVTIRDEVPESSELNTTLARIQNANDGTYKIYTEGDKVVVREVDSTMSGWSKYPYKSDSLGAIKKRYNENGYYCQ